MRICHLPLSLISQTSLKFLKNKIKPQRDLKCHFCVDYTSSNAEKGIKGKASISTCILEIQKERNSTGLQSKWLYNQERLTYAKKPIFQLLVMKAFCQWWFWSFKIVLGENKCWPWMSDSRNKEKVSSSLNLCPLCSLKSPFPLGEGEGLEGPKGAMAR